MVLFMPALVRFPFSPEQILDNVQEVINTVAKLKPASAKGTYFRTIHVSTTMSPGVTIDKSTVTGI
jgi:large subunit ribosomal protein L1